MELPPIPSEQVSVRLPADMLRVVDRLADRFACTRSAVVRGALACIARHPELETDLRAICSPLTQADTRTEAQQQAQEVYFQELNTNWLTSAMATPANAAPHEIRRTAARR